MFMEDFEQEILEEKQNTPKKDILLAVIITEVICMAIILAVILLMKYFSANDFSSVRDFYSEHFLTETTVSDVIKE